MAVMDVMDDIFEQIDKRYSGLGIYLDLKKDLMRLTTVFCCTNV